MSTYCLKIILVAVSVVGLSACTSRIDQRGKVPQKEILDQINPGVTSKEEVMRYLGSPSSVAAFDDRTWLYVHKRTETVAFFTPKVLEKGVIKIQFSPTGVVEEIHQLDAEGHDIAPVRRSTVSSTSNESWTQQIFGNFGRRRNKK